MKFLRILVGFLLVAWTLSVAAEQVVLKNQPYVGHSSERCVRCYDLTYDTAGSRPLVIFIHGGGWQMSDHRGDYVDAMRTYFLGEGYDFASVGYRKLRPRDFTNPKQLPIRPALQVHSLAHVFADTAQGIAAIRDRINPTELHLIGHSAGASSIALIAAKEPLLNRFGMTQSDITSLTLLDGQAYDLMLAKKNRRWLEKLDAHFQLNGRGYRLNSATHYVSRFFPDHPRVFVAHGDRAKVLRTFEQAHYYLRFLRRNGIEHHAVQLNRKHTKFARFLEEKDDPLREMIMRHLRGEETGCGSLASDVKGELTKGGKLVCE